MSYRIIEKGDKSATSEYLFKCSCGIYVNKTFKISEDKPDRFPCSCGSELVRDFGSISFPFINGRMDPNSPNYWQRNKSTLDIAKVYSNETEPY